VAGRLRLDLAQFRELEAFAEFGSELDRASQAQLERGARVVEILKQLQYEPMSVEHQVMIIFAVTNGYLDDVPVADCKRFEVELLEYVGSRHAGIGKHIAGKGTLTDEIEQQLREAIEEFKKQFVPSEAGPGTRGGVVGGGPVDERKPDVGWDRVGEREPEEERPERPAETEGEAGPDGTIEAPGPPG
jgi:F-type H+-transporting ATPase subunit alpha